MRAAPSTKPFIAAFIGNATIAAAKFVAAFLTASSAMLAEGFHSVREFKPHKRGRGTWRTIRSSKDPTKFTVVLEDGAATIGIVLAAAGVWLSARTGDARYDAAATIAIGLLLCTMAVVLATESKGLLLGEGAQAEIVKAIRATVQSDEDVVSVRNLLTMHLGPAEVLLNLDVEFKSSLVYPQIAAAVERLEAKIRAEHGIVKQIFIEARSIRPGGQG
jgi:divalent metal cation (Fe/Co/Zn/Cd) transporter